MLAVFRVILVLILSIGICIFGIIYCLVKPQSPNRTSVFSRLFGKMAPIFGVKVEIRNKLKNGFPKSCIYIANHQNNYDMVTLAYVVPPSTITVGKKSLLWIPLFGQLFWLSGNILISRVQSIRSYSAIVQKIIAIIKTHSFSVWIFPEGTRNYGKGLLPFKTGAFYAAISAQVSVVPICVSNISNNKIQLNRWSNGLVIIEIMDPVLTQSYRLNQVRFITKYCYTIMNKKINELNEEVTVREAQINL